MLSILAKPGSAVQRCSSCLQTPFTRTPAGQNLVRNISNSPYGRTHVWKRRPLKLPAPMVPQFPQRVIRSDGTTFTHWTTSPRSIIRLTRDVTNNPLWNSAAWGSHGVDEEDEATGRLGRFQRRFEESIDMDWLEAGAGGLESTGNGKGESGKK